MNIKQKVENLSKIAGVYIMKSKRGETLYVGKASSLKRRVGSYFSSPGSIKTNALLENVVDIDYIECDSPEQALILEAAFIKERKPKYNIALKDSKSYPYVEVTKENFPRIFISRPKKKGENLIFGPYPRVKTLKSALMLIRKIFPYRSCKVMPKHVCLFYHLKLCPAPCVGKMHLFDYKVNIENICRILRGERKELVRSLEGKMNRLAKKRFFEKAAIVRNKLLAVDSLYSGRPEIHEVISLKKILNLPHFPLSIEAVDVSSFDGCSAAGSLVVFKDGVPDKNNYRRFLIKEAGNRDDYAMIGEVMRRRYSRLMKEKGKLPDLIIIDGGKGHVQRAKQELDRLSLKIPLIGIAKRNEEIWFPSRRMPLIVSKDSSCLRLIQRVRDEAHRFAHKYHKLLRRKRMIEKE